MMNLYSEIDESTMKIQALFIHPHIVPNPTFFFLLRNTKGEVLKIVYSTLLSYSKGGWGLGPVKLQKDKSIIEVVYTTLSLYLKNL